MAKTEMVRKRLNVPKDSEDVLEWMEAQTDASVSIRLLIRDFLDAHGCVDRVGVAYARDMDRAPERRRKNAADIGAPSKGGSYGGIATAPGGRRLQGFAQPQKEPAAAEPARGNISRAPRPPRGQEPAPTGGGEAFGSEGGDMADILGTL